MQRAMVGQWIIFVASLIEKLRYTWTFKTSSTTYNYSNHFQGRSVHRGRGLLMHTFYYSNADVTLGKEEWTTCSHTVGVLFTYQLLVHLWFTPFRFSLWGFPCFCGQYPWTELETAQSSFCSCISSPHKHFHKLWQCVCPQQSGTLLALYLSH